MLLHFASQVTGLICDPSGTLVYKLYGTWDHQVEGTAVSPDGKPTSSSKVFLLLESPPPKAESVSPFVFLFICP